MNPISFFEENEIQYFDGKDSHIAYRKFGTGPPILFIHGFPVYGYTWRFLLPRLSATHSCYVVDLVGLGYSKWNKATDFHFTAQARRLIDFVTSLGIQNCSIIAHNTGATTARLVALSEKLRVQNLVLINTEVPGHRPPWIPLYQQVGKLPLSPYVFGTFLKNDVFVRSSMGFKEFYSNKELLKNKTYLNPYLKLVTQSTHHIQGALAYLIGCNFKYMDSLKDRHKEIAAKVSLIWGEDDRTFPVSYGEELATQFTHCSFYRIAKASLMPHEEKPEEVLEILISELG
ncbi:MAG: alpha/beta hydrolase [Bacteroidota bacterium]